MLYGHGLVGVEQRHLEVDPRGGIGKKEPAVSDACDGNVRNATLLGWLFASGRGELCVLQ